MFVALLRGINVGGRNKVPMADLRALAADLGWTNVFTYIASGNLFFDAAAEAAAIETTLEGAIDRRFGITIPVIVRVTAQWPDLIAANPFPEAADAEPDRLMLCLTKAAPRDDAASKLEEHARNGEQVRLAGGALWVYYPKGAGTSRLSPSLFDRLAGSPVTARNWRTVIKVGEFLMT